MLLWKYILNWQEATPCAVKGHFCARFSQKFNNETINKMIYTLVYCIYKFDFGYCLQSLS